MKLTCMRGYSGSGKSTRAAEIAKETGAVIVNRDQIRKMLLNSWWTGKTEDEDRVTVAEEAQVIALLSAGSPVIVDSTHLYPPFLRKWARLATRLGVDFEVVDVHAPVDECKRRVYERWQAEQGTDAARYLTSESIGRQYRRWPVRKWPTVEAVPFTVEPVEYMPGLPDAIIVDIDGTLAHMTGRSPYDYDRVDEDDVDLTIRGIVDDWLDNGHSRQVLIVSGRDSECRAATLKWLDDKCVFYDWLIMRPEDAKDERGNKLPDYQVKYHLFNEHIRGKYNVRFVLDDRTQVVDMWRQLGLKCLQVQPGDF